MFGRRSSAVHGAAVRTQLALTVDVKGDLPDAFADHDRLGAPESEDDIGEWRHQDQGVAPAHLGDSGLLAQDHLRPRGKSVEFRHGLRRNREALRDPSGPAGDLVAQLERHDVRSARPQQPFGDQHDRRRRRGRRQDEAVAELLERRPRELEPAGHRET